MFYSLAPCLLSYTVSGDVMYSHTRNKRCRLVKFSEYLS